MMLQYNFYHNPYYHQYNSIKYDTKDLSDSEFENISEDRNYMMNQSYKYFNILLANYLPSDFWVKMIPLI